MNPATIAPASNADRFSVRKETLSFWTSDGIRLDADLYRPQTDEPLPLLLMRQPYGRAIASTVVYAHPRWYAEQGYLVLIQDVRGCGSSTGEFELFAHEAADGAETIAWAQQLPGCNGRVGLYGFSYQGMTQLYTASVAVGAVQAIAPAMLGPDLYHHWATEGGAFRLQLSLAWALQLEGLQAQRRQDHASWQQLRAAGQQLQSEAGIQAAETLLQELAPNSFYFDWQRSPEDDYWHAIAPDLSAIDIPALHIGGWFDPYLNGTIATYQTLKQQTTAPQWLRIGPWAHLPWGRQAGAIDFGAEAVSPIDELQVRWFDAWLKDQPDCLEDEPAIAVFEMGRNQWRSLADWPTGTPQIWSIASDGLAAMRSDRGRLQPGAGHNQTDDLLVHDPWRPVPNLGGHNGLAAGPQERNAIEERSDILKYRSEPFASGLLICGQPRLYLICESDRPSWDLYVVLSRQTATGLWDFSQGFRRVKQVEAGAGYWVDLQPTCQRLSAGDRLCLSVALAAYPAFAVNPGNGDLPTATVPVNAQVITIQVQSAGSFLELPTVAIAVSDESA
ncbi:CocE/NonD family hydrolase [Synechococcus elongatus IITB3]|uniref:CocE/NonD family hydrolase n=1 Tax=Synechococcus elongatus TaxID=32046 RepID=UPI0030CA6479